MYSRIYFVVTVILSLILTACEPPVEEVVHLFRISEGEHYSNARHVEALQSNTLQFRAMFDSSASYNFNDPYYQDSKNKLLGFSDCNSLHHENSARFAWQWFNNRIEIFAYCYVNSVRVEKFLGETTFGENALYKLEVNNNNYVFTFKDNTITIPRGADCNRGAYFMLWPYFGGQLPAPHDVKIFITRY